MNATTPREGASKGILAVTLREIESELPNGLHDAKITAISRDFDAESVDVHLKVLVGLPEDEPARRSEFRQGLLRFKGAKIVIVEEPDVESPFASAGSVNFVLTEDKAGSIADELLKKLQGEYHTYTFFVQEWFSNLRIAATGLEFTWD
jgi:hypothetical protein